ncbi:MAG: LamG domain-containing protein [Rikenellaceae bacterium]
MYKFIYFAIATCLLSSCIITDDVEYEDLNNTSSGLLLYITFDGQTAKDYSGHSYNGIAGGNNYVTNTPNGTGYAYNIVSASDYVTIPYNPLKGRTEYTISFWVRDPSQGLLINTYGNDTNNRYTNYPAIRVNDNKLYACFKSYSISSDYFNYDTSSVLQNGNWHHVVVTVTPYSQALYVNASKAATQQASVSESQSSEIHIGGALSDYTGAMMKIDNLRIYSRAITAEEIKLIYNEEGM